MKKEPTYIEMITQVEEILDRLGRTPVDIDKLAAEVSAAEKLLSKCRERLLRAAGEELGVSSEVSSLGL